MADLLSGCCHSVASSINLRSAPDCAYRLRGVSASRNCTPARLSLHVGPRTTAISKLGGKSNRSDEVMSLPYTGTAEAVCHFLTFILFFFFFFKLHKFHNFFSFLSFIALKQKGLCSTLTNDPRNNKIIGITVSQQKIELFNIHNS